MAILLEQILRCQGGSLSVDIFLVISLDLSNPLGSSFLRAAWIQTTQSKQSLGRGVGRGEGGKKKKGVLCDSVTGCKSTVVSPFFSFFSPVIALRRRY